MMKWFYKWLASKIQDSQNDQEPEPTGLIIGSIIYSLPFAIQPLQISFEKITKNIIEQAHILQKTNSFIFFKIIRTIY